MDNPTALRGISAALDILDKVRYNKHLATKETSCKQLH